MFSSEATTTLNAGRHSHGLQELQWVKNHAV